jgi:hypothetical protein
MTSPMTPATRRDVRAVEGEAKLFADLVDPLRSGRPLFPPDGGFPFRTAA